MKIPSLPVDRFIDPKVNDVSEGGRQFLDTLVNQLQTNFSEEGLVVPSQSATNITIIQDNQNENGSFTCQGGTLIYNPDANSLMVSILVAGVPTFKTITVS